MSRLLEPSTWAGFAAIIIGIKPFFPVQHGILFDFAASACGGVAVTLRERGTR